MLIARSLYFKLWLRLIINRKRSRTQVFDKCLIFVSFVSFLALQVDLNLGKKLTNSLRLTHCFCTQVKDFFVSIFICLSNLIGKL